MTKSLELQISELIWEREPGVERGVEPEACARAAVALAKVLGCLVAAVTIREPEAHDAVVSMCVDLIEKTASQVRDSAREIADMARQA